MKRSTKLFLRSFILSSLVVFCIFGYFFGIAVTFERIRKTAFGEERRAVEYSDGELSILDFTFHLPETNKSNNN